MSSLCFCYVKEKDLKRERHQEIELDLCTTSPSKQNPREARTYGFNAAHEYSLGTPANP